MNEYWLPVPVNGMEKYYSISSEGRVKSESRVVIRKNARKNTVKERILRQSLVGHGYLSVMMNGERESRRFLVHRLVAKAFIKSKNQLQNEVNHIDGVKANNTMKNLEWCTSSENKKHAINVLGVNRSKSFYFLNIRSHIKTYTSINLINGESKNYDGVKGLESSGLHISGVRRSINTGRPYKGLFFSVKDNILEHASEIRREVKKLRQNKARLTR